MDLSEDKLETRDIPSFFDQSNLKTRERKSLFDQSNLKTRERKSLFDQSNLKTRERKSLFNEDDLETRENIGFQNQSNIKTRENKIEEPETQDLEEPETKEITKEQLEHLKKYEYKEQDRQRDFLYKKQEQQKELESIKNQIEIFKEEKKIVEKRGKCDSIKGFEQIIEDYKNKKIIGDFYPYQLINKLSCYFQTHVELSSQINSNITELKTITEGVQGKIYTAVFKNIRDAIVLKQSKRDNDNEIIHEFFVALVALNRLRELIPNFMYIYGTFHCGDPKEGKGWCDQKTENQKTFLICEKISGKLLPNSLFNCNIEQFLSYLLQIVGALQIAEEQFSFTHYDLHGGNIILRDHTLPYFYIKYQDIFIKTDKIATIIDYGLSSIKVNGKWYGLSSYSREKLLHHKYNTLNPDFDLFKVIGGSYVYSTSYKNKNISEFTRMILLEYFNVDTNNKPEFDKVLKTGFNWPKEGRSMGTFLNYIGTNKAIKPILDKILIRQLPESEKTKILCLSDICLTKI